MGLVQDKVITEISKKIDDTHFYNYKIGPELRYVGASANSNNNNFEEELLLGTDKSVQIQRELTEDSPSRLKTTETIRFKKSDSSDDYYVLSTVTEEEREMIVDETNKKLIVNIIPKVYSKTANLSFIHNTLSSDISEKADTYSYNDVLHTASIVSEISQE